MTFSVKISGYQCFGDLPQGFDEIRTLNVIIGKNNSGKSSLLDMVGFACRLEENRSNGNNGAGTLHYCVPIQPSMLGPFPPNVSGGEVSNWNSHRAYAEQFIGKPISWSQDLAEKQSRPKNIIAPDHREKDAWERVPSIEGSRPWRNYRYLRLGAARDISTAQLEHGIDPGDWNEDGSSVTRTVTAFLRKQSLPKEVVTEVLLRQLNRICGPDTFRGIDARTGDNNSWEVCLDEAGKPGEIPLSKSGAGLKTILCVLTLMELRSRLLRRPGADEPKVVYAIEELENNLHPALQRRLLSYIRERAIETKSTVFLTTHSPVAIDFFEGDAEAQIVHVRHDGSHAFVTRVDSYKSKHSIVDDIGARASDLLQANCVVWVEGPSDRIYFNRWIELWTNGELREGAHYQCMFYGGALLAHCSAEDPECETELVRLLRLNRHAIGLFDHDGDSASSALKLRVQRVFDELVASGGVSWVTAGREVENYIPVELLTTVAGIPIRKAKSPFANLPAILAADRTGAYARAYRGNGKKIWLAYDMRDRLSKEALETHLDLSSKLESVVAYIRRVNMLD
jgi:putative ATP-dependent endonuclease of the OLD family